MSIQKISWAELEPEFLDSWGWPDGRNEAEHLSIVGPTGSGKSYFQSYVVKKRADLRGSYVIVIATKPADKTLRNMHWPVINKYPPPWGKHTQFILWPKGSKNAAHSLMEQRYQIGTCLTEIWQADANTIVVFDEIAYVEEELRLKTLINRYWREGRSIGISVVATTQRPRNVSRYMWSEPSWIVAFAPPDEDEARRVAEIIGGRRKFTAPLAELGRHEFIIINRRSKEAYISKIGT